MTAEQLYYQRHLNSFRMVIVRAVRWWIDEGRCVICNHPGQVIHHRDYAPLKQGILAEIRNSVWLCFGCHDHFHNG